MKPSNHQTVHSLTDDTLQDFYRERGFSGTVGFGDRPAIMVIDLAKAWTDLSSPIGTDLSGVLKETTRILNIARSKNVPIFFTTMAYEPDLRDCGDVVLKKVPLQKMLVKGSEWVQIHPDLEMQPNEVLIVKQRASAFFGTTLLSQLIAKKIDTLIITGCSTSGCIRGTSQDAHDYNFHTIIPREAVGDRSPTAHEANLFDINARMGDVLPVDKVLAYIEGL